MSQQKLFTIGLAGTPNVGKSTIFNALTKCISTPETGRENRGLLLASSIIKMFPV